MKSLKKSVVFLVVLAMVLSTVAPVFAATPTDVVGTDYEEAVGKLVTLGVIAGYEDGTFKPDQNITRAEFSKIACYVVGVKDAAELSKGATKFKDVPATHWASGYVNIASEKGMLKGYPDGTFKPEANVTYAEAVTILVRALGMGPVVEGNGTWPANYLARAAAAGITDDVAGLTATGSAIRGTIAQLTWNTLDAEKWGEREYSAEGIVYGPLGKALIRDVYPDYAYQNDNNDWVTKSFSKVTVVGTQLAYDSNLKKNEIVLDVKADSDLADIFGAGLETVKVLDTTIDLNSLFGKEVNLLLGKDNKVAYIKASSDDVVAGLIEEYNENDEKIEVNGKEYAFKNDAVVYLNGRSVTALTGDAEDFEGTDYDAFVTTVENSSVFANLVLDGGKIQYATFSVADDIVAGSDMTQGVIKEIKKNGEVKDLNDATLFDIDDLEADDDYTVIVKNGKPATVEDIKEGDAVTYLTNGTRYVVYASDVAVTGEVTKVSSDDEGNNPADVRKKITVDDKVYKMVADGSVLMSKTGDEDEVEAIDNTVADFKGETVTLKLNSLGDIVYISGDVKASATAEIGITTKVPTENGDDYNLKLLTQDGVVKTFVVSGEHFYELNAGATELDDSVATEHDLDDIATVIDSKGIVVAYSASADGKIDAEDLYVFNDAGNTIDDGDLQVVFLGANPDTTITAINDDAQKLTIDVATNEYDGSYYVNSKTVYLNSHNANVEKIDGWSSLISDDANAGTMAANTLFEDAADTYLILEDDGSTTIKTFIVSVLEASYESSDAEFGIYVDSESDRNDDYITLFVDGEEVTYATDSGFSGAGYNEGDLVKFELNGEGEYDVVASGVRAAITDMQDLADVAKDVYKVDRYDAEDRVVTFETAGFRTEDEEEGSVKSVKLASDAVVYVVDEDGAVETATLSDISKGKYIVVDDFDNEDEDYSVVVIFE